MSDGIPAVDYKAIRGDTLSLPLDFSTSTYDLTGSRLRMQVKRNQNLTDTILEFDESFDGGAIILTKTKEEMQDVVTGSFVYDLEITLASGFRKTIQKGTFTIYKDTTI